MYRLLVLAIVGLAYGAPIWATDGDACATTGRLARRGVEVKCTVVCDSKDENSTTCSDFTIAEAADTYVLEISEDEDCDAGVSVDINTQSFSTTDEHNLTALTVGGTTRVVIDGFAAHPSTILNFDLNPMTNCTDFDVLLWQFFDENR